MKDKGNEVVSLQDTVKETIKNRIQELIGSRSIRKAAADWGLTYSTLNNYLTRGSQPRIEAAKKIAEVEGVTVEWILYGLNSKPNEAVTDRSLSLNAESEWMRLHDSMTAEERKAFTRIVYRHGLSAILQLSDDENIRLLALPSRVKKISLMLKDWPSEKLKEISASLEGNEHADTPVVMLDNDQKKHA